MSETHTTARATGQAQASRLVRLRLSSLGTVIMLIVQFILGVIYNLYGTAPTSTKSIGLFSSPDLALHVILGILLFLFIPIVLILIYAFNSSNIQSWPLPGLTTDWFGKTWNDLDVRTSLSLCRVAGL